ncbi:hypothetical protein PL321_10840 [Caloramator sp. mosi_1]|uniref:hypothetical protein n=1 Tax=Caloramator sp. mosi_1 TaxID=3023090 RepID=UPI0023608D88|nr:hypothetical protein [Caloramator sp. mosi_1]WDC83274.1 hypothetical protein PL321_10840 [Caloramator sp. mosi_1]
MGDNYQRPHHIARSLAKFGNEVIYITPANRVEINQNDIDIEVLNKLTFENKKVIDDVKIFSTISAVFNGKEVKNNYFNVVQNFVTLHQGELEPIIITYLPSQVEVLKEIKGKYFHIYECVDEHSDIEYAFGETGLMLFVNRS